ncbi:MAG: class I SAM-dependent methyltransferase [Flavobacteriales bacterium]|nr:class I SAM-dependent methyltransferase [Flavobacteriales bacterium]
MSFFDLIRSLFKGPSDRALAAQLRQPSGAMAKKIGERMNGINRVLYDKTWSVMDIADGQHILEIGFGNGLFFHDLMAHANNLRVSGLDFSEAMVKEAREHNTALVRSGELDLRNGNSDHMPFTNASYDSIFCINVAYFWEDPGAHLREIKRVLKPNGRFFTTIRTKKSMEQMPFTQYGFKMYEPEDWAATLHGNGFVADNIITMEEPVMELGGGHFRPISSVIVASVA